MGAELGTIHDLLAHTSTRIAERYALFTQQRCVVEEPPRAVSGNPRAGTREAWVSPAIPSWNRSSTGSGSWTCSGTPRPR